MAKVSLFPNFSNKMTAEALGVVMDEIGITATDLATRMDVDRKTVGRWLAGKVPVPGSVALLMHVAHEALQWSHVWEGHGVAEQDVPAVRVNVAAKQQRK